MSLETSRLDSAHADKATVSTVRETFRNALLSALSEARSSTLKMEPRFRDQLMADLTEYFNPDGRASDLFEAFADVTTMIDEHIEELTDDLAVARRQLGIAAE